MCSIKHSLAKLYISELLAKVMVVSAGQKWLQLKEVTEKFGIDLGKND